MLLLVNISLLFLITVLNSVRAQSDRCGFDTKDPEGIISNPSDSLYNNGNCNWTIRAPTGCKILLRTTNFNIYNSYSPYGGNCSERSIHIESLRGNTSVSHGTYCGYLYPPDILSEGNQMRIQLRSKSPYNPNCYFTFVYTTVPPPTARNLTKHWIANNTAKFSDLRDDIPRAIPALFLFNETYFLQGNAIASCLANEFRLQLAAALVRSHNDLKSAPALSHHIIALLALCCNPRSFYGVDLVSNLRKVMNPDEGLPNPFCYLTLCNAGERLTSDDMKKLISITECHKKEVFWLDFQATALMALVCVNKQKSNVYDIQKVIERASNSMKEHQLKDGSFGSLQTTSLVVQALQAANSRDIGWNRTNAVKFIDNCNNTDGSFGNMYNLFSAIPVISGKTLLYVNSSRCDFTPEGLTPLEEIKDKRGKLIRFSISVKTRDHNGYTSTISIKVPEGTKFFDCMRLAAQADKKFKFPCKVVNDVCYVNEINGLVNDPSSGKYWTFFSGTDAENLKPHFNGMKDYIPSDGDKVVMCYTTVPIEHRWQDIDIHEKPAEYGETDAQFEEMGEEF